MKINQLRCILVVFLLFVICANSIAQNRFSRSISKKYGRKGYGDTTFKYFRDPIGDTTRKFKLPIYDMSFELNILKTRLNEIKFDTTDFEYIPIYTIDINIIKNINDLLLKIRIKNSTYYNHNYIEYPCKYNYRSGEFTYKQLYEIGKVDSNFIILSQVLIIKKKNFKIIGSMYFGNDNCFFMNNGSYKNGYLKHNRYYKLSTAECYSTEAIDWISEKNNRMISKMLKEHNHQQFLIKINDIQGLFYFLQNGKIQFFELKHASNPSIPVRPQY